MNSQASNLILSCLISIILAGDDSLAIRGVPVNKLNLYKPLPGNKFSCFNDTSKEFDFSVVNDDYCDCEDGSDEPGTSACSNSYFSCTNKGFKPSIILSSRVNDGVCDPECCDGSDEYDGKIVCPDVCSKVAEETESKEKSYTQMVEKSLKIKSGYIAQFSAFKKNNQADIDRLKKLISEAKIRVEELKKTKEQKEKEDKERGDSNKDTKANAGESQSKILEDKIDDLKDVVSGLQEDVKHLQSILEDLKLNHNQNYHDLAVKGAVTAYDEFVQNYSEIDVDTDSRFAYEKTAEHTEFDASEGEELKVESAFFGSDSFQRIYHEIIKLRNRLFNYASGILPIGPLDVNQARNQFYDAESELRNQESDLEKAQKKLATDFGTEGEYVALNDKCFDFVNSEYTYTVCMFGDVHQKSKHDSTLLGRFEKWEGPNYDMQLYSGGTRCWHGPDRLTKITLECGSEEKILEVTEPEKCEYQMRMTTPAACQPFKKGSGDEEEKDEL